MKEAQPPSVPQKQIESDLARLESGIRDLKLQYDMFFAGSLKKQPVELRAELQRMVRRYLNAPIPRYADRFHFNALVSRFNSLSELWGKTLRTMEEGDRRMHASPEPAGVRERLLARCRVSDPRHDHEAMQQLYRRFQDAHRRNGLEQPALSFDKFVRGVSNQTRRLQERSGCGEIELRLVLEDQKVQLKARPRR